jgi:hypothetical protein
MSVVLVAEGDDHGSRSDWFERWARDRHRAGFAGGEPHDATLFVRGDLTLPAPSGLPNPYLTVFERTGSVSPDVVKRIIAGRPIESPFPSLRRVFGFEPVFLIGEPTDLAAASGILVILVDNAAPDRADEFNAWYNDIHLAEVARAGGFRAAIRYENCTPHPGQPRYLTIYQTDGDPTDARRGVLASVGEMHLWPAMQQFHAGDYVRCR